MTFPDRPRFRVRRGAVVALLLVLAFGVAAALGIQAYGVARYHRAQADRVLRDYAALAAARVAGRSTQAIYYALTPPLKAIEHAHEMAPDKLPAPHELHVDAMESVFSLTPYIRFTFKLDLLNKRLETAGELLPSAVRSWLVDTLPLHARTVYDTAWHMGDMGTILGQPAGDRRYVAYTLLRDKKGVAHAALGFEAKPRRRVRFDGIDHHQRPVRRRDLSLRGPIHVTVHRARHHRHRHGGSLRARHTARIGRRPADHRRSPQIPFAADSWTARADRGTDRDGSVSAAA
ncbi:MAG: hypothetical protein JF602_10165 [Gemmatimonadetes bacterium]|nr:hypothetical protein [Gemmatimonadota bacterium]